MFWLPLAMAGAGLLQGKQAEKDQKRHNLAAAESTRYSSWSKQNPMQQRFGGQTALGGAMQGGLGGLAMAQQMGGFKPQDSTGGSTSSSMFGGDQYAKELGDIGSGMNAPQPTGGGMDGSMFASNEYKPSSWSSMMPKRSYTGR